MELERIRKDPKATLKVRENPDMAVSVVPGGGTDAFQAGGKTVRIDVIFPVLHGTYSEDGTIQGLFEMADIPYVGCGVMASAITMDKEKTKQLWEQAGLAVVPYVCIRRCELNDSRVYDSLVGKAVDTLGFPLFVKPCCAGSSVGTSKVTTAKQLSVALMEAFLWDDKILIEKAVNAREIECSVTGNSISAAADSETVRAYIPGEIIPSHEFYDYDAKYTDPNGAALKIPADLSPDGLEQIRKTAVAAYRAVDAAGLSRVDFLVDKNTGFQYLNEINSIPGFTSISMFPKMCDAGGLSFTPLTELLIDEAVRRYRARAALQTSR
jgi:D-alanine-D-alanine ligase